MLIGKRINWGNPIWPNIADKLYYMSPMNCCLKGNWSNASYLGASHPNVRPSLIQLLIITSHFSHQIWHFSRFFAFLLLYLLLFFLNTWCRSEPASYRRYNYMSDQNSFSISCRLSQQSVWPWKLRHLPLWMFQKLAAFFWWTKISI